MATVIINMGESFIAQKDFEGEKRLTIGRLPSNDIVLDNIAVSSRHAFIEKKGEDFYIEDLESTNGTIIDNYRIYRRKLKNGDTIQIGKYQLKFWEKITTASFDDEK